MPRVAVDDNSRMNFRLAAEAKAKLMRAAALRGTDLTNFVVESALREAETVIRQAEVIRVSERDHQRILKLLENPPGPNDKLRGAAEAMPSPR
jgi:uncharacterized protein (DUF1778 family)